MLPSELLITRTKKDRIYPDFAQLDEEHLGLAEELIGVYQNFTGKKKSEIDEIVEELEQGLNFKRIRGLRTLLERRCTFTSKYLIEPVLARRAVFEEASSRRITNINERAAVIATVADALNISVVDLEQSLWADHESEVILEEFNPLNPEELLKWYNLSLAQTLLFKSTGMTITVKSKAPAIFRAIKYFGLMYLQEEGDKVRIEGASSLLKLSEKYGTSLAKLLPVIVKSDAWELDAEIVIRRDTPRIYHFIMDSRDRDILVREDRLSEAVPPTFDSSIEERFYHEFVALPAAKHWELIREPDVLFTRNGVFIPDFKFQHKELDIETYFEVVGFWTEEYIKRKLAKLRALPITVLVAIDKNLACFNAAQFDLGLDQPVILYSKKVPIGDVVRYLANIEREAITKQVERLKETQMELEGDIIPIKKIAHKYGMSQEAIRTSVKHPNYVVFKEVIVRKELLSQIKEKLVAVEKYVEARKTIGDAGLPNADEVLAHLGFKVQWKGLDVNEARIGPD
jgi:predicted nuclease of restriction endonuclease-like RecB superfamily